MVTAFHNKLFVGINEGLDELEEKLKQAPSRRDSIDIKSAIHFYENYLSDNLRNFVLIMHLSNFEEISTLVCRKAGVNIGKTSSINRFKKGWERELGKPLGDVAAWAVLKEAGDADVSVMAGGELRALAEAMQRGIEPRETMDLIRGGIPQEPEPGREWRP